MALMIDRNAPGKEVSEAQLAYKGIQPLIKAKKYELAIMALEKLATAYPDFAVAYNDLGVLYYDRGDKDKSVVNFEKALELQPDNLVMKKNLANYYHIEQERLEEAMQLYLEILQKKPEDIETLLAVADVCISVERINDAKSFYNRVLEIEPWNSKAWQILQAIK